jgi:aspartate racemase
MHIGLIGGIGPAATAYYYHGIVRAFAADDRPLHLTIAHTDVQTLVKNLTEAAPGRQAAEYARVTGQLAAAGAGAVAITSMGGHFCVNEFAAISPLPILNGVEAVGQALRQRGYQRVGLLGTRVVMETGLYGMLEGMETVAPLGPDLEQAAQDYMAVGSTGTATQEQHDRLIGYARAMSERQGAEAIILGGTDLFVVFGDKTFEFPVIDCADIHIEAIVNAAAAD